MRRRHLKKLVSHNSKRGLVEIHKQAHSHGSKKLRRRSRALRRLSRQGARRKRRWYLNALDLLTSLRDYEPKNETERAGIRASIAKIEALVADYERKRRLEEEIKQAQKEWQGQLRRLRSMWSSGWLAAAGAM